MIGSRQLSVSEAEGIHELLLETATMVDKLAFYVDETNDRELESIFGAHLRAFEQNYSELLGFAQGGGAQIPEVGADHHGHVAVSGGQKPNRQTIRPEPTGRINDRTMAMDCLTCCKSLAVACITVATEASSRTLRRTLADQSREHLEMAYELYKIAEQHGWYPSLKPHDNPEEWLRSTHLPISNSEEGIHGWREMAPAGFAGGAEPSRGMHAMPGRSTYGVRGGIPDAPVNYGTAGATRTATGANWGAAGHSYGIAPGEQAPFQYGASDSTSDGSIRR